MQLLGHFALGYFSGLIVGKYTKEKIFIPAIWVCSMLPDLDKLANHFMIHRGPSHSILVAIALFVPIFFVARRWLPYFAAVASHTLIGDFFNPPEKLFWPVSNEWFGAPSNLSLFDNNLRIIEIFLFALMAITMLVIYLRSKNSEPRVSTSILNS